MLFFANILLYKWFWNLNFMNNTFAYKKAWKRQYWLCLTLPLFYQSMPHIMSCAFIQENCANKIFNILILSISCKGLLTTHRKYKIHDCFLRKQFHALFVLLLIFHRISIKTKINHLSRQCVVNDFLFFKYTVITIITGKNRVPGRADINECLNRTRGKAWKMNDDDRGERRCN